MYDIIGDIHSCYIEFTMLLEKLGYVFEGEVYKHPEGRKIISVGDIMDRGDYPVATFTLIKHMTESGDMLSVRGNHCEKIWKWAKGGGVKLSHGADKTARDFESISYPKEDIITFFDKVPFYMLLDDGKLAVVHAAWKDRNMETDPFDHKRLKGDCLYGPTTGERDAWDLPIRIDWAAQRVLTKTSPFVVYGHQMHREPYLKNHSVDIDTGCAFGGKLTALRYPEIQFVDVKALRAYAQWKGVEGDD